LIVEGETPTDIVRCSAFGDGKVTCDKHCVELMNEGIDLSTDGDG
jgi:hypothetical protein